jgi:hypothetical protein
MLWLPTASILTDPDGHSKIFLSVNLRLMKSPIDYAEQLQHRKARSGKGVALRGDANDTRWMKTEKIHH